MELQEQLNNVLPLVAPTPDNKHVSKLCTATGATASLATMQLVVLYRHFTIPL